jgi:hypothetical protein
MFVGPPFVELISAWLALCAVKWAIIIQAKLHGMSFLEFLRLNLVA